MTESNRTSNPMSHEPMHTFCCGGYGEHENKCDCQCHYLIEECHRKFLEIDWLTSALRESTSREATLRAALEKIANPDDRFEGEGECEAIARKTLAEQPSETTDGHEGR